MKRTILAFVMVIALLPSLSLVVAESPFPMYQMQFNLGGRIDQPRSMSVNSKNEIFVNGFQVLPVGSSEGNRPAIAKISSSGQLMWIHVDSTKSATSVSNQITSSSDDKVFFGAGNEHDLNSFFIKGLDASRKEIWKKKTSSYAYLAMYGDTLVAVVIGDNTMCYLLRKNDGSEIRSFPLGIRLSRVTPRIQKNFLYFTGDDFITGGQSIGKISLDDGKLVWKTNFPMMAFGSCSVNGDIVCIAGSVVVPANTPSGTVYITAHFLARLDPNDGSVVWQRQWFSRETVETNYENGTYSVSVSSKGSIATGGAIQRGDIHQSSRTCYVKIFSANGDSLWEKRWNYPEVELQNPSLSQVTCVAFDRTDELLVLGFSVRNSAGNPPSILHVDKYHVDGVLGVPNPMTSLPTDFSLSQNYPNPFNPNTSISFEIGRTQRVLLVVYDLLGREVSVLVHEERSAGRYEVNFNASHLPSGTYLYRLQTADRTETKKFVLLK